MQPELKKRAKNKCNSQSVGGISDQSVRSLNKFQLCQQDVAKKITKAQIAQAQADVEKTKMKKFEKYMGLLEKRYFRL